METTSQTEKAQAPGVHPRPLWSVRPESDRQAGDAIVSNFILHWFPAKALKDSAADYRIMLGKVKEKLARERGFIL